MPRKPIPVETIPPREGSEEADLIPVRSYTPVKDRRKALKALPPLAVQGNSRRDRIGQWIALKTEDPHLTNQEIAEKMGITRGSLNSMIWAARKDGLLKFEDPLQKIEYQIIPKVVDNLMEFLDAKDKTVTLETAKGTIFKQYQQTKGVSDNPTNVLALKIEMPDAAQGMKVVTGQIVGQPRAAE